MLFLCNSHMLKSGRQSLQINGPNKTMYAIPTTLCTFFYHAGKAALFTDHQSDGARRRHTGRVFPAVFRPGRLRGSLTVEAALAVPVFLFAVLALSWLIRAESICEQVNQHLCSAARQTAAFSCANKSISSAAAAGFFQKDLSQSGISLQSIAGGRGGFFITVSDNDPQEGMFCLDVRYRIRIPGIAGFKRTLPVHDRVFCRSWTGIPLPDAPASSSESSETDSGKQFYVAENGVVYHTDPDCTYLDLSIQPADPVLVSHMHNVYGEKYTPCKSCAEGGASGIVYITDTGTCWHTDQHCSGLKRTISVHNEEEASRLHLRPCPRCGGNH